MDLDKDTVKKENKRNYMKKGFRSQNQHSKNQLVQTIEVPAINSSVFETKNNGYNNP